MKKLLALPLFLFLSGCMVWDGLIMLEHSNKHYNLLNTYINSSAKHKVLFQTKEPVLLYSYDELGGYSEQSFTKSYYSTAQDSFEFSIIEAYEYCKRDNEKNADEICELKMIGNFEATESEKNYTKKLLAGQFFQISIRNWNSNDCGYNNNYKEYEWWKCKTAVRVNPDNLTKKPDKPVIKNRRI